MFIVHNVESGPWSKACALHTWLVPVKYKATVHHESLSLTLYFAGVEQLNGEDTQKLIVCDEIGPEDATDLAFSRGSFVLYTRKEEIITSGR